MRLGNFVMGPIDMKVGDGEVAVVFGPNGAGKTTLLRSIVGYYRPSAGRIIIDGRDVTDEPIERRGVGYVPQDLALFENMDVRGNIEYGLKVRRVPSSERARRVAELAERLGLSEVLGRRVTELSGGMRQRVAIARALAVRPRVLLLDEPLSNLDPSSIEGALDLIRTSAREFDTSVIVVSQSIQRLLRVADSIYFMKSGRLTYLGSPEQAINDPKLVEAASYLGYDNVLPAPSLASGADRSAEDDMVAVRSTDVIVAPEGGCSGIEVRGRLIQTYYGVDGLLRGIVELPGSIRLRGIMASRASPGREVIACINPSKMVTVRP